MTSNNPLSRFESFARGLVEGSVDRLLGQPGILADISAGLVEAAVNGGSTRQSANHYIVRVHPDTLSELNQQVPDVQADLEEMLARKGESDRLLFAGDLHVELIADSSLAQGETKILASRLVVEDEPTAVLHRKKGATAPLRLRDAYLIVDGRRHYVIDKAVTSIGRSLNNDVVLEDSGVSRAHGQIRWRNGRFVIFDLASRSGIQVNGRRCTESELKSGDVITIGSAALIYGEEDPGEEIGEQSPSQAVDVTQELSTDHRS
jgi:hypothetical protein